MSKGQKIIDFQKVLNEMWLAKLRTELEKKIEQTSQEQSENKI